MMMEVTSIFYSFSLVDDLILAACTHCLWSNVFSHISFQILYSIIHRYIYLLSSMQMHQFFKYHFMKGKHYCLCIMFIKSVFLPPINLTYEPIHHVSWAHFFGRKPTLCNIDSCAMIKLLEYFIKCETLVEIDKIPVALIAKNSNYVE